jgi:uncharacterized repeat protein (TIGR01451 family)
MFAKFAFRSIAFVAVGLLVILPAVAQDEDHGTSTGGFNDAMSEIPALTVPYVEFDFDLMPQGPTTVGDILAQFPGSVAADFVFSTCTGSTPGSYGFQPNGRALAANPDGSLGLYLVDDTDGAFGCSDDLTITFSEPITQFAVQTGDWSGPLNFNVFDGGSNVGTIQVTTTNAPVHYIESTVPFDSLMLTAFPDNPGANYVFTTFQFPEGQAQGDSDIALTKTAAATSPTTGRYTIDVQNLGPDDATGVVVTDTLPAGVTYISDDCGGVMGTPWTWNVGGLLNGGNETCDINVDILDPTDTTNDASASADQNDPNGANNSGSATIPDFGGPIPTLGTTGTILLIVLIAGIGLVVMRRFF